MAVHNAPTVKPSAPARRIPLWRFALPMAVQLLLVLTVPLGQVGAYTSGSTVTLEIAPVDPYDMLRGRYMQLEYAIERPENLQALPGWQEGYAMGKHDLYVTLVPGAAGKPWQATHIGTERPSALRAGALAIRGRMKNGTLHLGLSQYYMPEDRGDAAEAAIRRSPKTARAELKVDEQGNSVLTGLLIEDQRY